FQMKEMMPILSGEVLAPPDARGRFGDYGGRFVPETLIPALDELLEAWTAARADAAYRDELALLLESYAGRPTPLFRADRLAHAQGRDERGAARLGHQRAQHLLLHRQRGGPPSLSGDGARAAEDHRRGDRGAGARARGPAARRGAGLRRRRIERHRRAAPIRRRAFGRALRRRGGGPRAGVGQARS